MGKDKIIMEDCVKCDSKYKLFSIGTLLGEYRWSKKDLGHSHFNMCKKCSKPVIEFLKNYLGNKI